MDVMMSDLPHIMYHPPKGLTEEEAANRRIIQQDQREKIKKGGLHAVAGLNLNFRRDKVIDGNALLAELKRK